MSVVIDTGLTPDQHQLVADHMGLISVALRGIGGYLTTAYSYDDAFQEGYFGLCRAVQLWDPERGAFSTLAVPHIFKAATYGRSRLDGTNWSRFIRGKEASYATPDSLDVQPFGDGPTYADLLEDQPAASTTDSRVGALIDGLTDRERTIVQLTMTEASAALGIKPNSVAVARVRLYRRLRQEVAA